MLLSQLGGHVGFAIYRPSHFDRSMVPLADTSACGNHNQFAQIARDHFTCQVNLLKRKDLEMFQCW